jgi:hypothetical protein
VAAVAPGPPDPEAGGYMMACESFDVHALWSAPVPDLATVGPDD